MKRFFLGSTKLKTKHRTISTEIPNKRDIEDLENLFSNESQSMHGQYPMIWDKAYDCYVQDRHGNKWIDFTSTIFLTNAGHANKQIIKAIKKTAKKSLLHSYTYATSERINYLNFLIQNTPEEFEKAFLLSAGTEATEAALKLMRLHAQSRNKKRPGIICIEGNYHGRTMGAQLMNSNESQKNWIGFKDPNIHFLPFPYEWQLEGIDPREFIQDSLNNLIARENLNPKEDICGFMLEAYQGWGACFYPKEYVQVVREFCDEHDLLLCFDEMQAGFGRTGKLFGYQHYDVKADILCCGKGSSSSLPLSIVLGSKQVMDLSPKGSMSSTHSANPICCSAAHANFKFILEKELIKNSEELGIILHHELQRIQANHSNIISHVQGKGLVAAIIFRDSNGNNLTQLATDICYHSLRLGLLLVNTGRESIKIGPPLCISKEALLEGIKVIEEAIISCSQ